MNTNYIKHFLIVIVFAMQCLTVSAETAEMSPVYICQKSTPKIKGNQGPSRAPAKHLVPISVFLDDNGCLFFENYSECEVAYIICDNDENLVCQDSFTGYNHSVHLDSLQSGQYTINIECNGVVYEGVVEL